MSIQIAILVEGETERVFLPKLREFLKIRLPANTMPKLTPLSFDGRLPTKDKLKRVVENLLADGNDVVIAITDVYTGTKEFADANDAKNKMRQWVGVQPNFYPHVALHDFEAWLLPFWSDIQKLAGSNRAAPGANPENVNHTKPPANWLKEIFRTGSKGKAYVKPRDGGRILRDQNLEVAANACPELKALLNTILSHCGTAPLP